MIVSAGDPKKMFTDSSFYNSKYHPTIADQVEMAHKLSSAMFTEQNKASKGAKMYLTRMENSGRSLSRLPVKVWVFSILEKSIDMTNGELLADNKEIDVANELPSINFLSPNYFTHDVPNNNEETKETIKIKQNKDVELASIVYPVEL